MFDYSCQGANWIYDDAAKKQQSPIDIKMKEITEFDGQFKVDFNYNQVKDVQLENIEWTLRVSSQSSLLKKTILRYTLIRFLNL